MRVEPAKPEPEVGPLAGFSVGITAARRREEFGAALERRGATVLYGPAIQIVQVEDNEALREVTLECLRHPPDVVVATTGIGFRGWIDAADGWGHGEDLLACLSIAVLLARGPKARGAMRAAGLSGEWSPASESSTEVLERLLEMNLQGRRVAIQQHGEPLPDVVQALEAAGATVVQVQVYRWRPPVDPVPLEKLCQAVVDRTLDAVTFTSAPAAASYLQAAERLGIARALIDAHCRDVMVLAVGPVTASPLDRVGIPVVQPDRARLGSLVREVASQLPNAHAKRLVAAGQRLEIRGHGVLLDGLYLNLPPTAMSLLGRLTAHPGQVISRSELASALPGGSADEHAVEMAIGRLRTALGNPRIIQTLVKRGYRIAYDPECGSTGRY
ncbi:uroporphyrinogen-III synthase [Nakamurella sp. UYEF19]|uniref:uroporphyrinogen-III synthase n=1 Tax=Nakamurella sp. UYEF19 TaxID=1756392 RepID=UPI0033992719